MHILTEHSLVMIRATASPKIHITGVTPASIIGVSMSLAENLKPHSKSNRQFYGEITLNPDPNLTDLYLPVTPERSQILCLS